MQAVRRMFRKERRSWIFLWCPLSGLFSALSMANECHTADTQSTSGIRQRNDGHWSTMMTIGQLWSSDDHLSTMMTIGQDWDEELITVYHNFLAISETSRQGQKFYNTVSFNCIIFNVLHIIQLCHCILLCKCIIFNMFTGILPYIDVISTFQCTLFTLFWRITSVFCVEK